MNSIYITSTNRFSGKTAVCLALGKIFQSDGYEVGYLKPLSVQPWLIQGHVADEDAAFVNEVLGLSANPWELSPVVLTPEMLRVYLTSQVKENLIPKIKAAYDSASDGKDILLLEGGGSLREGYVVGLPTPEVAKELCSNILVVVRYREEVRLFDDVLAAQTRLGDGMCGIILNRVPNDALNFVNDLAIPYFENRGIPVFGVLPEAQSLAALTVGELKDVLDAEILTKYYQPDAMVENMVVGAMTAEAALSRLRKYRRKAVITGGDRTDIQLAALETSTTCLILTGNLRPSGLVIKQAEEFGVPILLVRTNTMETIERIDTIYGKTRLGQTSKLEHFQVLLNQNVDVNRLKVAINLA